MGNLIPRHHCRSESKSLDLTPPYSHNRSLSKSLNLIPCSHNRSGVYGRFEVKLKILNRERVIYHYPDGKVVKSKAHLPTDGRGMYAVSSALNPIDCPHCKAWIIQIYDIAHACGHRFTGVEAFNQHRQVAAKFLVSGRYPLGFDIKDDLGLIEVVHVSTAQHLAAWLDRHRNPMAATGHAIVASLKRVVPLRSFEQDIQKEVCCVCLQGLTDEDGEETEDKDMEMEIMETGVVMKMPCRHTFHGNCILEWLLTSRHCPLCRSEI